MQGHRTSDLGGILESTYSIAHLYHITGDAPDFPSPEEPGRLQSMGWQSQTGLSTEHSHF